MNKKQRSFAEILADLLYRDIQIVQINGALFVQGLRNRNFTIYCFLESSNTNYLLLPRFQNKLARF